MTDTMNPTEVRDRAVQRLDDLAARHAAEREALHREIAREEAEAVVTLRAALRADAGEALAEAISDVERQLRRDHRAGSLHAKIVTALPTYLSRDLPALDRADHDEGRRAVLVHIDRPDQHGHRMPAAVAVIDCSDALFGSGSRRRLDDTLKADARLEAETREERRAADERQADQRRRPAAAW